MSKAIARLLRAAGFQPVSFASAEELLQTEAADSAACLVLDIHLPGLSGLELAAASGYIGRAKPVIFITGQDEAAPARRSAATRMRLFSQALRGQRICWRRFVRR